MKTQEEDKKLTRRERQAEALKNDILEAAVQVFNENGYEKATTKKIAERAEVSEGTLYNYFCSKREILITLFQKTIEDINNNLSVYSSIHSTDIKTLLSSGLSIQLNEIHSHSIMTLFLHEAKIDKDVQKIFSELMVTARLSAMNLFEQLSSEGKIRQINNKKMAMLMSIIGVGYTTLIETGDEDLIHMPIEEFTAEISDILVNGIQKL